MLCYGQIFCPNPANVHLIFIFIPKKITSPHAYFFHLLHEVSLLLLLGLPGLVPLLDVLDEPEGSVQVGGRGADLARLTNVRAAVSPEI